MLLALIIYGTSMVKDVNMERMAFILMCSNVRTQRGQGYNKCQFTCSKIELFIFFLIRVH